jgi:hypothetical protein
MFKRLSNSLLSPKEVAKYYGDSFGKSLLFLIILLFLLMTVTFVNLFTTNALTENLKKEIKKSFLKEEISFVIKDGELSHINNNSEYVYTKELTDIIHVVMTEDITKAGTPLNGYSIVFSKDGVYIKLPLEYKLLEYNDYEYLKNIDFSNTELLSDIKFWDNIFSITGSVLEEYKTTFLIVNMLYYLIYWTGWMFMIVLVVSLFTKMRTSTYLSFGSIFKVTIYNLAPLAVCLIFATLFNLGFLMYIGSIISMVYNMITINEVLKRLYLNRNEGN